MSKYGIVKEEYEVYIQSNENLTIFAEYVWIDSDLNLRSKIKVFTTSVKIYSKTDFPEWNFDGSSTGQSNTKNSDLILKPVYHINNPLIDDCDKLKDHEYYLVLCEILDHPSNNYQILNKIYDQTKHEEPWFGIEQEYMILDHDNKIHEESLIDLNSLDYNKNQHYCSVGTGKALGRKIATDHLHKCLKAGIKICGINSEVTPGQWEFQIGPLDSLKISHQLWLSRYILIQVAETHYATISFHPKPFPELNGSGAHTNFSTKSMREDGGIDKIYKAIDSLSKNHKHHIEVYGLYNDKRLVGTHETANINVFSYGQCDRSSSIRIPINVLKDKKGYLEDRRPAANIDPYLVTSRILKTVILQQYD